MRQNTNYSDWMAPAAVGVGAGVLGTEAYRHQQNKNLSSTNPISEEQQTPYEDERPRDLTGGHPTMPTTNDAATTNPSAFAANNGISGATYTSTAPLPVMIPSSSNHGAETPGAQSTDGLGGLESEGAHETGNFFPKVVRHDTDMSVSKLHVPGEFPPATPGFAPTAQKPEQRAQGSLSPRPAVGSHGTFIAPSAWDLARE
jgi:hypothetical protein